MIGKTNIKDVMKSVIELLLSRDGDVDTEDGSFATVGTDEIIHLECAVADYLNLPSDDVNHKDAELILLSINKLSAPQNEWISVDDRLPDQEYGHYLVARHYHSEPELVGVQYSFYIKDRVQARNHIEYYSRKDQGKNSVHFEACIGGMVITHWMPLPTPPKEI